MRAHQIMTRDVITVTPQTTIAEAANIMLGTHISGLPVTDAYGKLVGIVSERDLLRPSETGTGRKRPAWLQFFLGPGVVAADFVRERGRKIENVMTQDLVTATEETPLEDLVRLMEKKSVKRLPVMRGDKLAGIVTRSNLLQAVACMAHEIPDPTADDDHIRERITRAVASTDWRPIGFEVTVRNGVVHLHGLITSDKARQAPIIAAENTPGVKEVHDHLCLIDNYSGFLGTSPED